MAFEIDLLPVGSEKKSGDCIAMRYGDLVKGANCHSCRWWICRYLERQVETFSSKIL